MFEITILDCKYPELEKMYNNKNDEVIIRLERLNQLKEAKQYNTEMLELFDAVVQDYAELLNMAATGVQLAPTNELKKRWANTLLLFVWSSKEFLDRREEIASRVI